MNEMGGVGKARVLFVDDEANVLHSLARLFMDEPLEVITAASGMEGLEIVKNREIAVIISDQRMPVMDGAQFLEKVREISPHSIRMILTGYADVNAAMAAINKGGAYRYITKPWDDNDLVIAVKNAIETYRLARENIYLTELTQKQNVELQRWSSELELYVQQQTIDLTKRNQALQILNEKLNRNMNTFITSFSNLIELRDKSVCSHSNSVSVLSADIARRVGFSEAQTKEIFVAAQLHDIGKIGVPDIVLMKQMAEYTPEEMSEYRKHPVRGQTAVSFVEGLGEVGTFIRHHHEWFDGRGFPDGLRAEEIPVGSRIIAIADAFDRMAIIGSGVMSVERSLKEIERSLGKTFDGGLFGHLKAIADEKARLFVKTEGTVEIELAPKELLPGMIVMRDVRTGTGLLLIGRGIMLTESHIDAIERCCHLDPSKSGVYVKTDRSRIKR